MLLDDMMQLKFFLSCFNNETVVVDDQRVEKMPFFQILLKIASNVCFDSIFSSQRILAEYYQVLGFNFS